MKKILKDLKRRISLNRNRLSNSIYQYTDVFTQGGSWPGDFEGRDVLALTSLYHALDGYKEEQENILAQLKSLLIIFLYTPMLMATLENHLMENLLMNNKFPVTHGTYVALLNIITLPKMKNIFIKYNQS